MKFSKSIWADIACVALFAIISLVYFYPADTDGRRLTQHDNGAADGLGVEINEYRALNDGATPRWTNSVFGGMPTYQIAPSYDSTKGMSFIEKAYHLWLPDYVFYVFISLLGFYILLRAFNFKQWMAALGAIVWAFSSYFFIIIAAGHIWKVLTLAYIPPTIAGMVLCFRGKYLLGCALTALFASLQISSNHVQMTYYFLIPEALMVIAFLIDGLRRQGERHKPFIALGSIAVAAVIALALNASNLFHTYEYAKDTMRGKSELVKQGKTEDQTDSGLERSYITAWSYGIDETFTFLIPNAKGGASVPLSESKTAMEKADPQFNQVGIYGAFTQYWGEQPGTSGPVYLGALVCMLFILSLIVIPNNSPMKWALVAATILTVMLSWGKNFMGLTDFFIDYVPMYSKFRTVSSILVVAEFTIPLMALWGLKLWVKRPTLQPLLIAVGVTVALCIGYDFMTTNCISSHDRSAMSQYVQQGYFTQEMGNAILASLSKMRSAMIASDVARSIAFIAIGAACMWWFFKVSKKYDGDLKPAQATVLCVALLALCLADMWMVNKRYLNDSMFETPRAAQTIAKTPADEYILNTSGNKRDYRVLNFAVSTFNDNTTSFFYSNVGGYHAAKLRRYQELVEEHLRPEMSKVYSLLQSAPIDTLTMQVRQTPFPAYDLAAAGAAEQLPVINMLNTRWFILAGQNNMLIPVENNAAYGNAWMVDDIKWVDNANDEIAALHSVSPRHTAIIDRQFASLLDGKTIANDSTDYIRQTRLTADEVDYEVRSAKGSLAVLSEIYYPGWTATIDGQPADIMRADYVLRAIHIPAGEHKLHMEFHPQSVATTETIATVSFWLLIALLLGAIAMEVKRTKEQTC